MGNRFFVHSLWLVLLRNPKIRMSCFRILFLKFRQLDDRIPSDTQSLVQEAQDAPDSPTREFISDLIAKNDELSSYFINAQLV